MTTYHLKKQLSSLRSIRPDASWQKQQKEMLLSIVREEAESQQVLSWSTRVENAGTSFETFFANSFKVMATHSVAAILLVLVVLSGSAGYIVSAAENSLPGDSLYKVKTAVETARLKLTTSPQSKVALEVEFAARRLDEVTALTKMGGGNSLKVAELVSRFETDLTKVASTAKELSVSSPSSGVEVAKIVDARLGNYIYVLKNTSKTTDNSDLSRRVDKALIAVNKAETEGLKVIVNNDTSGDENVVNKLDVKIKNAEDNLKLAEARFKGGAKGAIEAHQSLEEAKKKMDAGDLKTAITIIAQVEDIVYKLNEVVIPEEVNGDVLGDVSKESVKEEVKTNSDTSVGLDNVGGPDSNK